MPESIADLRAHIERLKGDREVLRLQVKVLTAACDYYADPANWSSDNWAIQCVIAEYGNAGKVARDALAEAAKHREAK